MQHSYMEQCKHFAQQQSETTGVMRDISGDQSIVPGTHPLERGHEDASWNTEEARRREKPPRMKDNHGTLKTTIKPTKPQPNSQRTLSACAPIIKRTTPALHTSRHPIPMKSQATRHPQATHAHPRPRQSAQNNTATILHTPMRARHTLKNQVRQSTARRLRWYERQ